VMPIIAAIIGKPDFRNLTFTIHRSVFHYGAFLTICSSSWPSQPPSSSSSSSLSR
jgi:hypothetical protein